MSKAAPSSSPGSKAGFDLPPMQPTLKRRAARLYSALQEAYPDAHCELNYDTPHQLLIATILSAQATDVGVNKATPELFRAFPEPADYAAVSPEDIEPYINSIGLFRNKAKSVQCAMERIRDVYDGEVPSTMEDLLSLRGVARKTANVVLGNAFGIQHGRRGGHPCHATESSSRLVGRLDTPCHREGPDGTLPSAEVDDAEPPPDLPWATSMHRHATAVAKRTLSVVAFTWKQPVRADYFSSSTTTPNPPRLLT